MNTPVMGMREQFAVRHGNDGINVDGVIIFSNGARMERASYGCAWEPPTNPWELAKVKLLYREELLRRAVAKFNELKQQLTWRANEAIKWAASNNPPPTATADDVKELEALRDKVRHLQADVTTAQAAVDEAKPDFLRRRDEQAEASRERNTAALDAVMNVKI